MLVYLPLITVHGQVWPFLLNLRTVKTPYTHLIYPGFHSIEQYLFIQTG